MIFNVWSSMPSHPARSTGPHSCLRSGCMRSFASLRMTILKKVVSPLLSKLFQKSYIALEEQLNIIHAIFQNRNTFHTHAERESRNFCCVVIDEAVHIGIDHAASQQLNPSAGLTVAAGSAVAHALAIAENATDLYVGAGLGKRRG